MGEVTMPRLSDTMSEGTVGRWLKKPGDKISTGEIIAEIETDKATMELESFEDGTLQQILIPEGQTVPIGEIIAMIGDGPVVTTTAAPAAPAPAAAAPAPAAAPPAPAAAPAPTASSDDNGRVVASPVARRLAEELGVDLRLVQGTGPGGRIIKENVEEFAAKNPAGAPAPAAPAPTAPALAPAAPAPAARPSPAPAAPASATVTPLSRMRKAIARAMTDAKPGVPHIYVTVEVDMDPAMVLREQISTSGLKVSVNDLVVKAAAKALVAVPAVNTSFVTGPDGQPALAQHPMVNVSVAVALEDGLIAPVVRDTDKKSVGAIGAEIRELAGRAREGKSRQTDLEGATFQVTNLGMFGVVEFGSIITVPQAASLAVGAVRKIPVVRNDQIVVGQVMNLTLSADHRIVDGAVAAQYLKVLKELLENPLRILV
ncbi:MAG: dihydrolipoamide acetyltransferase family protein [Oscillochloridaceae bacterium umkhey_bin13]